MKSIFTGVSIFVLLSLLGYGEALFGKNGGGGGGKATKAKPSMAKLTPAMMEDAAKKAADAIVVWGTSTVFQLKQAAQLKGHVERLKTTPGSLNTLGDRVKMDTSMYKQVVQGALGGVFLTLNSPAMGKVSEMTKSLLKEEKRQARVIALDRKVKEAFTSMKAKGGAKAPSKDPEGFLEGALLNKDVSAAHDKFMSDVEALANSGLAKKVANSAEAYHHIMLKYATSKPSFEADAR